jgi:hypothetical protein
MSSVPVRAIEVKLTVYVPEEVVQDGEEAVAEYLNDKLNDDPEFFGEIDTACFTITDEAEF